MRLELDRSDLALKHKRCPVSGVTFEKLTSRAKIAVKIVGRATFYSETKKDHIAVYPTKKGEVENDANQESQ